MGKPIKVSDDNLEFLEEFKDGSWNSAITRIKDEYYIKQDIKTVVRDVIEDEMDEIREDMTTMREMAGGGMSEY